jgi:2-oxoglutarate ferredoxin oxidoreductase subunit alpha
MSTLQTEQKTSQITTAIVRFAGDSGDGMQLAGSQFTKVTGIAGNDLMTFPDFPAEIRAPQGTMAGVSGFQIHFGSDHIHTPGDRVDVLVAMNPAALKANIKDLRHGGTLIVNTNAFDERSIAKVHYESNPLEDEELRSNYNLVEAPISELNKTALEDLGLTAKEIDRSKNFFALGMTFWLFQRDMQPTLDWIEGKFKKVEKIKEANQRVLKAGFNFAETCELFQNQYEITKAEFEPGMYRNITGNSALAIGLAASAHLAELPMLYAGYPITPASDILHELSRYKNFNVKTFQAEDEIAAVCAAIGAAYGGTIGITASSGPGIALKSEAINLAVMTELPLVIVDVQRAGPSTGMPTKTEQADLLQAMFGRNGESPVAILAPSRPSDCFYIAMEAVRIALKYMTPVFIMSDGYLANGSEPWKLPHASELKKLDKHFVPEGADPANFKPYDRDPETLSRFWPVPGRPGFEHRIGGIEKDSLTGNISYDPDNHHRMTELRAQKIQGIENSIPEQDVYGDDSGDVLLLGWGSTYGSMRTAVEHLREKGISVSHAHLRYINPVPKNLEKVLRRFKKVIMPEINTGQMAMLLRSKYLIDIEPFSKVRGRPYFCYRPGREGAERHRSAEVIGSPSPERHYYGRR